MTEKNASGSAVAERLRASSLTIGDSSSVTAMLANALREGKPLADDGALHDTIQEAENVASSFVFVPPGTFEENVSITTTGLTLLGSGNSSVIQNSNQCITVDADNISLTDFKCISDTDGIDGTGHTINVNNVNVTAGRWAIECGFETTVSNCTVRGSASNGILTRSDTCKIINNNVDIDGRGLFIDGDDTIVAHNIVSGDNIGIDLIDRCNNTIVIGNIIPNGNTSVQVQLGCDNIIVANNRAAESIADSGTGTTLDANLTGSFN